MIVFLAGMQRSGSTFSFNVTRDLLAARGSVYQEPFSSISDVVQRAGDADHIIAKAHQADDMTVKLIKHGAIRAVCTVRRPEDAIASWMEVFGFKLDESIASMLAWLEMFSKIRDHSLVIRYEMIDTKPWHAAWRVGKYICPDLRVREVFQISRKYSKQNVKNLTDAMRPSDSDIQNIGFSYFNKENLFHRGHVTTMESRPARERIGEGAVAEIRKALRSHIDDRGDLKAS